MHGQRLGGGTEEGDQPLSAVKVYTLRLLVLDTISCKTKKRTSSFKFHTNNRRDECTLASICRIGCFGQARA